MKSILIGNGLSSMIDEGFKYESLLDKIREEGAIAPELDQIFSHLNSSDFEAILGKLDDTILVLESLDESGIVSRIKVIRNQCREALIAAVSKVCPALQDQTLLDTDSVNDELVKYESIFTTNYDVLLYWCCKSGSEWTIDDLFRRLGFYPEAGSSKPRIYYLHGAMHIFHAGANITKLKASPDEGFEGALVQKIKKKIKSGDYPMFVSESSSEKKFNKISDNRYLRYCYDKLSSLEGELDIFGHSLREEVDSHLLDAICRSDLKTINIFSYKHTEEPSSGNVMRERMKKEFKGEIHVFDSNKHPLHSAWCVLENLES